MRKTWCACVKVWRATCTQQLPISKYELRNFMISQGKCSLMQFHGACRLCSMFIYYLIECESVCIERILWLPLIDAWSVFFFRFFLLCNQNRKQYCIMWHVEYISCWKSDGEKSVVCVNWLLIKMECHQVSFLSLLIVVTGAVIGCCYSVCFSTCETIVELIWDFFKKREKNLVCMPVLTLLIKINFIQKFKSICRFGLFFLTIFDGFLFSRPVWFC